MSSKTDGQNHGGLLPALELRGISLSYLNDLGKQESVLEGVDLDIYEHDFVVLLGASGSGKTTLLRAIAGLEHPDAGTVLWHGQDITELPSHLRGFALMFQDEQLFPHMNVAENIAYPLKIRSVSAAIRQEKVTELLELIGLPGFETKRVDTLSGGEAQRVALARALASEPQLLLLDEPLSSLDSELRIRLGEDLLAIAKSRGIPVLMVTHDLHEAEAMATRTLRIRNRNLVELGNG
ncbi:MAG: ABC transporter ATP-binding protein [Microbacteriaceae bacterium]